VKLDEFKALLNREAPPTGLSPLLEALWKERSGDWDGAHKLAQDIETPAGAWVHAYLHRREGDLSNAGYWYEQAGKPKATGSMDSEWEQIARVLLDTAV
jgi:hypothetical protein